MIGFVFILLFGGMIQDGSFEGKIVYSVKIESLNPNYSEHELIEIFGDRREFYISGARYLIVNESSYENYELYDPDMNQIYYFSEQGDTVEFADASLSIIKVLKAEQTLSEDTVLGYSCKMLEVETSLSRTQYWFNERLYIKPNLFREHKMSYWDLYTDLTSSIPLKVKYDFGEITVEYTAIEIFVGKIPQEMFRLPEKIIVRRKFE